MSAENMDQSMMGRRSALKMLGGAGASLAGLEMAGMPAAGWSSACGTGTVAQQAFTLGDLRRFLLDGEALDHRRAVLQAPVPVGRIM